MSENIPVYSIQRTYIIKPVYKSEKHVLTCDERIDIPTIEPLTNIEIFISESALLKIIPCVEIAGNFLSNFNLEFETNEGVTVLPVKIPSGSNNPKENPYRHDRYVLVLPRGATGVKSCKLIDKVTGLEVQHNFTFGIMPPPYNYDNALFGFLSYRVAGNRDNIFAVQSRVTKLEARVTALENEVTNLKARVTALENKEGV